MYTMRRKHIILWRIFFAYLKLVICCTGVQHILVWLSLPSCAVCLGDVETCKTQQGPGPQLVCLGEAFKVRTAEHGEQVVRNSPTQYWLDISEQSFRPRIIFSLMWQKYLKHVQTHTHLTTKGRTLSRSFTSCHRCGMKRKYIFQKFRPDRHCTLTFWMLN